MINDHKYLGTGLNDGAFTHFFALQVKDARIVKRYPASGNPAEGLPLSVDVQVQTARNPGYFLRYPLSTASCPNALVVIRTNDNQVIGHTIINTDVTNSCRGTGRITLIPTYRPSEAGHVMIEVYEDTVAMNDIDDITALYTSQPVQLNVDFRTGLDTGQFGEEVQTGLSGLFGDLTGLAGNVAKVGGIGLMGYLIYKNSDSITNRIKRATT